ncbi:MAG TPA: hypothetical protein VHV31_17060 [Nitrolancea sp.]|jgi:hypothetical protein|nr:hypothetical protein [Nitrolancea sp.]
MFPRWPLRRRALYNLWLGGVIAAGSIPAFIWESHAAVIGMLLGVALLISGLVAYNRSRAPQLEQPVKLSD